MEVEALLYMKSGMTAFTVTKNNKPKIKIATTMKLTSTLVLFKNPLPLVLLCLCMFGFLSSAIAQEIKITDSGGSDITEINIQAEVGSSSEVWYMLGASNLSSNGVLTLTVGRASGPFSISTQSGGPYGNSISLNANSDGAIDQVPIYIKYEPTADATSHTDFISHTSEGITTKDLTLKGSTQGTLPVELTSFSAKRRQADVLLEWHTASESNNSHFEVEMAGSANAAFTKVDQVRSKAGNSSIAARYNYTHAGHRFSGTLYYRLKQVDLDGTYAYSKVVAVDMPSVAYASLHVAPNPLSEASKVYYTSTADGKATLVLHTTTGKRVYTQTIDVFAGHNMLQLPPFQQLSTGLYILTVEQEGQTYRVKIVKK
jgi:hypothetical protein